MAPVCCLTILYQTQKLCVRCVDESLAVRNLGFSQQRCRRLKPPGMLGCVSGVTVLDVSKDRSAFMFLDYLTPVEELSLRCGHKIWGSKILEQNNAQHTLSCYNLLLTDTEASLPVRDILSSNDPPQPRRRGRRDL
jgi:hypothetical protein